jgi:hypothetical protein
MQLPINISTLKGTEVKRTTLALGERYTFANSASTVLVVDHLDPASPEGNAHINFVTPAKASSNYEIEDPVEAIAPGETRVFGALPSTTFSGTVEFTALGTDVSANLVQAYVLEVRTYG